jgi:3'(2'), 5'-bisphosphate nucleotidase
MDKSLQIDKNLLLAIKASIDAGNEIMKIYEQDFDIELKSDSSPLTIADKNANEVINKYLQKTNIPIISEENAQIDYSIRRKWDTCWIVDPLDGTKEFINKNGEFTVNIALIKKGSPVLGVLYVPVEKKLYYADVNEELAFLVNLNNNTNKLNELIKESSQLKRNKSLFKDKIRVVVSKSHLNDETKKFIKNIESSNKKTEIVSKGSSLKFCLVAEGKADVYPRFAPTMEWDSAAAHAICKAVGISITNTKTNKELSYNKEELINPYFICK